MAIKACTQEQGHLLRNRDQMQMVKESLDEGYCDISGRAGELDYVGKTLTVLLRRTAYKMQQVIWVASKSTFQEVPILQT